MTKQKRKQPLRSLEKQAISVTEHAVKRRVLNDDALKSNYLKWWLALGVLVVTIIICFVSGIFSWGIKYAECGDAPVVISESFGGRGERLYPGDENYSPGFFEDYECMSPEEKAGKRY